MDVRKTKTSELLAELAYEVAHDMRTARGRDCAAEVDSRIPIPAEAREAMCAFDRCGHSSSDHEGAGRCRVGVDTEEGWVACCCERHTTPAPPVPAPATIGDGWTTLDKLVPGDVFETEGDCIGAVAKAVHNADGAIAVYPISEGGAAGPPVRQLKFGLHVRRLQVVTADSMVVRNDYSTMDRMARAMQGDSSERDWNELTGVEQGRYRSLALSALRVLCSRGAK